MGIPCLGEHKFGNIGPGDFGKRHGHRQVQANLVVARVGAVQEHRGPDNDPIQVAGPDQLLVGLVVGISPALIMSHKKS